MSTQPEGERVQCMISLKFYSCVDTPYSEKKKKKLEMSLKRQQLEVLQEIIVLPDTSLNVFRYSIHRTCSKR